jgi:hypothetical protein
VNAAGLVRRLAVGSAILSALSVTACGRGPVVDSLPPVPSTLPLRSTVAPQATVDRSREVLPTLPRGIDPASGVSSTSTTIDFAAGRASITGIVTGPDGPVAGATVRVERLVGEGSAVRDLITDADGRYRLENVQLGRIRLRAWRSPDLAQTTEEVLFVSAQMERLIALERFARSDVQWAMAPSPPRRGGRVNVVVQLTTRQVSTDGVVGVEPLTGVGVSLYQQGVLQVLTAGEKLTDERGRALFTLQCVEIGAAEVIARLAVGGEARLGLPACTDPPPETTAAPIVVTAEPTTTLSEPVPALPADPAAGTTPDAVQPGPGDAALPVVTVPVPLPSAVPEVTAVAPGPVPAAAATTVA